MHRPRNQVNRAIRSGPFSERHGLLLLRNGCPIPAYHRPTGNGSRNIAARTSTVGSWTPFRYTNVSEPYAPGGLGQPFVQCFFWGRPPILIPWTIFFESRPCQTFYITGFLSVSAYDEYTFVPWLNR